MYVDNLWCFVRLKNSGRSLDTPATTQTTRAGTHRGSVGGQQLASDQRKWLNVITDQYAVLYEQYVHCDGVSAGAARLLGTPTGPICNLC